MTETDVFDPRIQRCLFRLLDAVFGVESRSRKRGQPAVLINKAEVEASFMAKPEPVVEFGALCRSVGKAFVALKVHDPEKYVKMEDQLRTLPSVSAPEFVLRRTSNAVCKNIDSALSITMSFVAYNCDLESGKAKPTPKGSRLAMFRIKRNMRRIISRRFAARRRADAHWFSAFNWSLGQLASPGASGHAIRSGFINYSEFSALLRGIARGVDAAHILSNERSVLNLFDEWEEISDAELELFLSDRYTASADDNDNEVDSESGSDGDEALSNKANDAPVATHHRLVDPLASEEEHRKVRGTAFCSVMRKYKLVVSDKWLAAH